MGFRNGAYATVWNITIPKKGDGYCYGKVTISRKDGDGKYINTFNGVVFFSKDANEKARGLGLPETVEGDHPPFKRILIQSSDTTNKFDSENYAKAIKEAGDNEELKKYIGSHATITTHTVYDFDLAEDSTASSGKSSTAKSAAAKTKAKSPATVEADEEEELPF